MTRFQRFREFLFSIVTIISAVVLILLPEYGVYAVLFLVTFSLIFSGLYTLVYYFSMARYMVNGQLVLIKGVILLNFGLLMLTLSNAPRQYVMIYLLIYHGFRGLTTTLNALQTRQMRVPSWKTGFIMGLIDLLLSLLCIIFINSSNTMVYIYCLSLFSSAVSRIIRAFRQTAMIYIQ